jgi:predicted transcriptional regulator
MESLAKVLSAKNRALLRVIAERAPGSLEQLAALTGRRESNLSRTLKTLETYRVITLTRGRRGRLTPHVCADRIAFEVPLLATRVPRRRRAG